MTISLIKTGIVLFSFTVIGMAHSNDLITFGKQCLAKEEGLNNAKKRLDGLSLKSDRDHRKNSKSYDYLDRYLAEKAQLESAMNECAETTPNSAYCHQVRQRYNELDYLIQQVKADTVENRFGTNDATIQFEITRNNFNQRYDDFLALCRDSDTHYALIQDARAYAEVCSTPEAKKSITCSLF